MLTNSPAKKTFLNTAQLVFIFSVLLFITIVQTLLAQTSSLTTDLQNCEYREIGLRIKCSPQWDVTAMPNTIIFVISTEPRVVVTINKLRTSKTLDQLIVPKKGRSQLGGQEAIRNEIRTPGNDRMVDFFTVKDYYTYSVNFTVNPSSKWKEYYPIFDVMIDSFQFLQ